MHVKFYCDLYVSQGWQRKKATLKRKLKKRKLLPSVYIIALSQGSQNQLEFFSSVLLRQHVFDHSGLFVVGMADGYSEALFLVEQITDNAYHKTGTADIRRFIQERQEEFEKTGR